MAMERYEVHGFKAYQLNIYDAIHDYGHCPGFTMNQR
jgi:hypothetical protein